MAIRSLTKIGLALGVLLSLSVRAGEGPCPVPEVASEMISRRNCYPVPEPVEALRLLADRQMIEVAVALGHYYIPYGDSPVPLVCPAPRGDEPTLFLSETGALTLFLPERNETVLLLTGVQDFEEVNFAHSCDWKSFALAVTQQNLDRRAVYYFELREKITP